MKNNDIQLVLRRCFARKASIVALSLVAAVFVTQAVMYTTCVHYTQVPVQNCGSPPSEGGLCSGRCYTYSFSANCGLCTWTGYPWDSCNAVNPFPITMTRTAYLCDVWVVPYIEYEEDMCICTDETVPAETTISTKICNCW